MPDSATVSPILSADRFCPNCGYNLRGTDGLRCPECGGQYAAHELATNRIPWTHRKSIHRVRAFINTSNIATFRPRLLAVTFDSGIFWRDARLFRLLIILPPAIALILVMLFNEGWQLVSMAPGFWLSPKSNMWGAIGTWPDQLGVPWYIGMSHWWISIPTVLALANSLSLVPMRLLSFARLPEDRRGAALSAAQYVNGSLFGGVLVGAAIGVAMLRALMSLRNETLLDLRLGTLLFPAILLPLACAVIFWVHACYRFYRQAALTAGAFLWPFWLMLPALLLVVITFWLFLVPSCAGLVVMIVQTLTR